jgi:hypothetical protein
MYFSQIWRKMCHTYSKQQSKLRLCFPLRIKIDWLINRLIPSFMVRVLSPSEWSERPSIYIFFGTIIGLLSLTQGVVHLTTFFLGTYQLRPAVKKAYHLRPKVSASCVSVAFRVVNRVVEEMYQFGPKGSAAYTETQPNLLNRPGSEPARDTTHPHKHTHTHTHTHTHK